MGYTGMAAGIDDAAVGAGYGTARGGHVINYTAGPDNAGVALRKCTAARYGANSSNLNLLYVCMLSKTSKQRLAVQTVHVSASAQVCTLERMGFISYSYPADGRNG